MSDPKNVAAFDVYPKEDFYWSARGPFQPGFRYMGM